MTVDYDTMRRLTTLLAFLCITATLSAQSGAVKVACIGFYNFENLFDTLDSPNTRDFEFTPKGPNHYTDKIYREKLDHLADVVSQLGTELTPDGVAVLGVCEIENRQVLEDFVAHPKLAHRNYQIIHFDSRDSRGIDVALIYQAKYFKPTFTKNLPLPTRIQADGDTSYSRDILIVAGELDGEAVAFSVNHWPSRRGGEAATAPLRKAAAKINKTIADSLSAAGVKTIIMGDLNDDPVSESVRLVLDAQGKVKHVKSGRMYNPMYDYYKRGIGTTAYRDAWSLFDQIILTDQFVGNQEGFRFHQAKVFNPPWLTQRLGQYKGYPFRTYSGGSYLGGYSDHFAVYVFLVKALD